MQRRIWALVVTSTMAMSLLAAAAPRVFAAELTAGRIATRAPVRIASGGNFSLGHTCQVNGDGTVRCWGANGQGELGDGTTTTRLIPVTVIGLTNAVAVSAGDFFSCALIADGTVRCWGINSRGQIGDGTSTGRTSPVTVSGLTSVVAISSNRDHSCALLVDGTARCWGENLFGELGDGSFNNQLVPIVVRGLSRASAITAGGYHTCALIADGTARCWGDNEHGELGENSTVTYEPFPVTVSGLANAKSISAGSSSTCALVADGSARCWGSNTNGQLGDGTFTNRRQPVVVSGLAEAFAIADGGDHTCVVESSGEARCWGFLLGNGTTATSAVPVVVSGLVSSVAIAASQDHTCIVVTDDSARCWGENADGEVGDGTHDFRSSPATVSGGGGSVTARSVSAGFEYTCALRANNTASCWGSGTFGVLGNGSWTGSTTPLALNLTNIAAITTGENHACALVGDGSARCWGSDYDGQLGDGVIRDQNIPVPPIRVSGLSHAVGITAGDVHACALLGSGTVRCWGANSDGQLGDGTDTLRTLTVAVVGLGNAVAISAGGNHTCALIANGTVRCWGDNFDGDLGDATTTGRLQPVTVSGLTDAVAIDAGLNYTCALLVNGTEKCWGANPDGQLGDGTTTRHVLPRDVTGLSSATSIAAGDNSCAVTVAGNAFCWGANDAGEVGDGTTTQRLTPTKVQVRVSSFNLSFFVPLSGVVQVTNGGGFPGSHACAVTAAGAVFCWGNNNEGQVGDGTTTNRLTATAVPSFTINIDPRVVLKSGGRAAKVTIIGTCAAGDRLHVDVSLRQGTVTGKGAGDFDCVGGLQRYPVTVTAQGGAAFSAGSATVTAKARILDPGSSVGYQTWTRAVTIAN